MFSGKQTFFPKWWFIVGLPINSMMIFQFVMLVRLSEAMVLIGGVGGSSYSPIRYSVHGRWD